MIFPFPSPLFLLSFLSALLYANALSIKPEPKAKLGSGTAIGATLDGIESWRGIPFAQPPLGSLRLLPPRPAEKLTGTKEFIKDPDSCFNVKFSNSSLKTLPPSQQAKLDQLLQEDAATETAKVLAANINNSTATQSEDCLYLNVYRPEGTKEDSKLPVVVWVYGGSFATSDIKEYRPETFLKKSKELSQDVIFVEMNYRLGAYGFLSGKDAVKNNATNVGLLDQRMAFQWVHDNIDAFGGDPTKVTLWGQSAGAISLGHHLVSYGKTSSEGLYRSMIMESGAPARFSKSSSETIWTQLITSSGCIFKFDKFKCMQELPADKFNKAMSSAVGTFAPVADGNFIPDYPDNLVRQGRFVKDAAILIGNERDEGTLLTVPFIPIVTNELTFDLFLRLSIPGLKGSQYSQIKSLYPSQPSKGAPYNTGDDYDITGFNKRVASVYGDYFFQYPRRNLVSNLGSSENSGVFNYLHATSKSTPLVGAYHSSELVNTFGWLNSSVSDEMMARWIGFINTQKPNANGYSDFPMYTAEGKETLHFGEKQSKVTKDDYREEPIGYFEQILENVE